MAKINGNQKGKRGELQVVHWLWALGFPDAHRTQQYNGKGKSDVECPTSLPHLHIEVKHWDDFSNKKLREAIFQAERDCPDGSNFCVVWRCTGNKEANEWRITYLYKDRLMSVPPNVGVCRNKLIELNHIAESGHD